MLFAYDPWKDTFDASADTEGPDQTVLRLPDQTVHSHSLIWAFIVHLQNHWTL